MQRHRIFPACGVGGDDEMSEYDDADFGRSDDESMAPGRYPDVASRGNMTATIESVVYTAPVAVGSKEETT